MKNLLILTVFSMLLFSSCKQDELTLTHKKSGTLSVVLKDAGGVSISNSKLILQRWDTEIDDVVTDAAGLGNFGSVREGIYRIYGEDIKDGELAYTFHRSVIVNSAHATNVTIVPSDYNASLELSLREETSDGIYRPFESDVKIALVKVSDEYNGVESFVVDAEFNYMKENTLIELRADGTGYNYKFENIPLHDYMVMIYTDADHYVLQFEIDYLKKGHTRSRESTISSVEIRKHELDQTFSVNQYALNSTGLVPYENCKVHIVHYDDYNNISYNMRMDFTAINKISAASSTTDATGEVTFSVPAYKPVYAIFFAPDNTYLGKSRRYTNSGNFDTISHTVRK